jgi:GTP-binding protein
LFDLRNKKNIVAKNGERGGNQKSSGHDGKTEYIPVPLGTTVYDDKGNVIVDILHDNESYVICHGGNGGHGNAFFKSSFNRIPSLHERGDIGEEKNIELQIRYMADIGLVGLPNAGKSTLISKVSNASPKIANYQFTTLSPVLGTVKINNDTLVFEDVPGLIEGASDGKGLGKKFLKHIERCYILIHLISLSKNDNEDIVGAYNTIINELQQYSSYVSEKKIILVGNKIDTDDFQDNLQKLEKYLNKKIFTISAKEKTNVDNLLKLIYDDYHNILVELKKQSSQENVVLVNDVKYDAETLTDKLIRATTVKKTGDRIYTVYSQYLDY